MKDTHHPKCERSLHGTAYECTCRMARRLKKSFPPRENTAYAALPVMSNSLGRDTGCYWTAPTRSET